MDGNYQRILEILRPNIIILPQENNIIEQSIQEIKEVIKPLQKEFKENLENHIVTEEDTVNQLACAICLDPFQKNDIVIRLPCNGMDHFFHKGENKEECEGVLPWFEQHNTCPICRSEFPAEPEPEPEPEPELPDSLRPTTNTTLTPEQIAGIHISQDNILDIRNDIENVLRNIMEERNNGVVHNNEEQVNNEESVNNEEPVNNEVNLHIQRIIAPFINNIFREEVERLEEEEIQEAIFRSMGER